MVCGMTLQVGATEKNEEGEISDCIISLSCESNGVGISLSTTATSKADKIGCESIVLEEKVNGSWKAINVDGGYSENSYSYNGGRIYTGAVKGRVYRAHCVHYAIWGGKRKEQYNSIGEMIYN